MNYKVRELTTNGIYVAKDDKNVYRRVKLDKKYTKLIYKVHLIDSGGFDIVEEENIFHITKRFAKIKPFAIKGCLASRNFFLDFKIYLMFLYRFFQMKI